MNESSKQFAALMARMTQAICRGDGHAVAACFTEDGVYHDGFYGEFRGRAAIVAMIEQYFHRDARDFTWQVFDPVADDLHGYARYDFSYVPKIEGGASVRTGFKGISACTLQNGLIEHYGEQFDRGTVLAKLGFADARILKTLKKWAAE
jgi:SnoaL-like domain